MGTVAEVVAVVHVINVNVIGLIPVRCPGFRPRINNREPEAAVLEARASVDDDHGRAVHAEIVSPAKMLAEPVLWNAIAHVTSAVVPGAVFTFPMPSTLARPDIVGRRMRCVVVVGHVFVRWMVLRLTNIVVVRLLMLRRTRHTVVFGPRYLVVFRVLRRSLVVVVMTLRAAAMFVLMILRTAVMVIIVSVLCVRGGACR